MLYYMSYVLDTSAVLSGKDLPLTVDVYVPPGVLDEIKKGGRWYRKVKFMMAAGLKVVTPPGAFIEAVEKKAKSTGDYLRLSRTDVEVIALALHLNAEILTDDYSIQNMAKNMDISYSGISQKGIKKEYMWSYRCRKCGRWYREGVEECEVCGGEVRTTRGF